GASGRFAVGASTTRVEFVLHHFSLQCIAMDSQQPGGRALVMFAALQCALDHALLQYLYGLLQEDAGIQQLLNHILKSVSHSSFPRWAGFESPYRSRCP